MEDLPVGNGQPVETEYDNENLYHVVFSISHAPKDVNNEVEKPRICDTYTDLAGLKQAYVYAYRIVFYSTIPFGVIAIIAAFFIADASRYLTNHTQVNLEKDILRWDDNNLSAVETKKRATE